MRCSLILFVLAVLAGCASAPAEPRLYGSDEVLSARMREWRSELQWKWHREQAAKPWSR